MAACTAGLSRPRGGPPDPGGPARPRGGPPVPGGPARRATAERGSVTAEFAVLLPVVVLLLGGVVAVTSTAATHLRCADAARAAARAAALGQSDGEVAAVARRVAGPGAVVAVRHDGGWVEVVVESGVGPALPLVGGLAVRGAATSRAEP
ncbi:MAG: pilus assembly protein [Micrococcales bacterium]|nr:pilus assembly protein [Micrococcales bacterium]